MRYEVDDDLHVLADRIIKKDRNELECLKIAYMFREEAAVTAGKVIVGRCIRVDDRNWALHSYDVLIEIARDVWAEAIEDYRNAVMDHELGHIGGAEGGAFDQDNKGRWKIYIKYHDIEEFTEVLERHGAYHQDLRKFLDAFAENRKKRKGDDDLDDIAAELDDLS